jgi:hypothetical protein
MSPPICLHASYGRCMVSSKVQINLVAFTEREFPLKMKPYFFSQAFNLSIGEKDK